MTVDLSRHGGLTFAPGESLTRELFLLRVHPDDRDAVVEAIEGARFSFRVPVAPTSESQEAA